MKSAVLVACLALLAACGSGVELRLFVSFDAPAPLAAGPVVVLSGEAALPAGSVRSGGTVSQPLVTCRPGTFSMAWTNDTNGTHGAVHALWDCPADRLTWSSSAIPLAPGANRITVTMVDAVGSVAAGLTVIREPGGAPPGEAVDPDRGSATPESTGSALHHAALPTAQKVSQAETLYFAARPCAATGTSRNRGSAPVPPISRPSSRS